MDIMLLASIAIIAVTGMVIIILALLSPLLFKIAFRNFTKRRKSSILAISGLLISSAIISGALAVGDSMEHAVIQSAYANLGEVDEVVQSLKSFNETLYTSMKDDNILNPMIDGLAPLILLPTSVVNKENKLTESKSSLIGFDNSFKELGEFISLNGSVYNEKLGPNETIINEKLAKGINAAAGQNITLTFRNPEYTIETLFSAFTDLSGHNLTQQNLTQHDFIIKQIVKNENLGRFQLGSSSVVSNNVFVNLTHLQNILDMESRINTIVVSNSGNAEEGVKRTEEVSQRLETILINEMGYRDAGFIVESAKDYVKVENRNIFFQERYLNVTKSAVSPSAHVDAFSPLTSYFVNTIISGSESIYYSVVTGFDPEIDSKFGLFTDNITGTEIKGEIEDDEIIITSYVAGRMGIGVGSTITLNYSIYSTSDAKLKEEFKFENFTVIYVVDIVGKADDEDIMPPFPGIKGTESCNDWDPPVDSFDKFLMEDADLDYWVEYHGTPKAYITLNKSKELWANDWGSLTTIKIKPTNNTSVNTLNSHVEEELNLEISYKDAGVSLVNIKKDSIDSAKGVQILTETFIAFGAVVVLAGMVLIVMLVGALVEERKREIGTLRAVGSKRSQVAKLFVFEGATLSSIASLIGTFVGIAIAYVCIFLTNTYWPNIVEGNVISLHFSITTLAVGFAAGFLIALLTFVFASYAASGIRISEALKGATASEIKTKKLGAPVSIAVLGLFCTLLFVFIDIGESLTALTGLLGPVLILLAIPFLLPSHKGLTMAVSAPIAIIYTIMFDLYYAAGSASSFVLFFLSGFVIVAACVLAIALNFKAIAASDRWLLSKLRAKAATVTVALLNPIRKLGRTAMSIALFAIVIFTLVALSANIAGQQTNLETAVEDQGGGYDVIGDTSVSLRFDLGNSTARSEEGLDDFPDETGVVQFLTFGSPGGTCTNLNKDLPPRLIGMNETFVQDNTLKFSSALNHDKEDADLIWSDLNTVREDDAIPAIGELNTVIWILQKDLGDNIEIVDEFGQTRQLVIVGITHNSIFPGSMFISEDNIETLYPTKSEYNFFLFETQEPSDLITYLETYLSPYGMDARLVEDAVKENLAVEWSYMSLFQSLLILGLFVGTAALALRTAKAVVERRKEIGILRALGFTKNMVLKVFLFESVYIALWGIFIGIFAGILVSVLFFGPTSEAGYIAVVPWLAIVIIALVVIIASLIAAALPSIKAAKMEPVNALRIEE